MYALNFRALHKAFAVVTPHGVRGLLTAPEPKDYRRKHGVNPLPASLHKAIDIVLEDQDFKKLKEVAAVLQLRLWKRLEPFEGAEIQQRAAVLQQEMFGDRLDHMSFDDREEVEPRVKNAIVKKMKATMYNWKPMIYDERTSRHYLAARTPMEYGVLRKIFKEIRLLDPVFEPQSCLDFGSGVGSTFWAIREQYPSSFKEYLGVDCSNDMNNLARLLVQDGDPSKSPPLDFYAHRAKLPASTKTKYDVVVSAFSLMEMPSMRDRLAVIEDLWRKSNRYLIIVENGSHAGFRIIEEARHLILNMVNKTEGKLPAYVLAPCTHNFACRRLKGLSRNYPCSFPIKFLDIKGVAAKSSCYSYVVLSRVQPEDKSGVSRIIEPILKRPRHVICRTCTSKGEIDELIVTKRKHPECYKSVRSSHWGDLFPYEDVKSAHVGGRWTGKVSKDEKAKEE